MQLVVPMRVTLVQGSQLLYRELKCTQNMHAHGCGMVSIAGALCCLAVLILSKLSCTIMKKYKLQPKASVLLSVRYIFY